MILEIGYLYRNSSLLQALSFIGQFTFSSSLFFFDINLFFLIRSIGLDKEDKGYRVGIIPG